MFKFHAVGNSTFYRAQPESFELRPELLGFAVRDRHEERSSLSPEGFAYGQFFCLATRWGKGALPPPAHSHLSADPSSGLSKTARRTPKILCSIVASVSVAACASREKPKPRRLGGRKGEMKRCP
jgi:hypothetical protein